MMMMLTQQQQQQSNSWRFRARKTAHWQSSNGARPRAARARYASRTLRTSFIDDDDDDAERTADTAIAWPRLQQQTRHQ